MKTQTTPDRTLRRLVGSTVLAGLVVLTAACGDGDDATASTEPERTTTTVATAAPPADPGDPVDHSNHVVTAVDFDFEDLPSEVAVGTRLSLENAAASELHELVALRLPETETRSAEEIMSLPPEEMQAVLGSLMAGGEPAMVLLAEPGGDQIPAVGDGTFSEPGRYLVLCAIPTGVDPAEYMAAAAKSQGGPPQIENAGPPHFVSGMYAEITVVP